jgi:hypothetical protein
MTTCISCGIICVLSIPCFNCREKVCNGCRAGGTLCTKCSNAERFLKDDMVYIYKAEKIVDYCKRCFSDDDYLSVKKFKDLLLVGSISKADILRERLKPNLTEDGLLILVYLEQVCCGYNVFLDMTINKKCSLDR